MKSLVALIHREYLEHKGAFLLAPSLIVALLAAVLVSGLGFGRFQLQQKFMLFPIVKVFEFGFLAVAGLWFAYMMAALFFYYADAFSADRRNNAMLFWKSMPVSDFKILASKMLAGLTLFPVLIFAAMVVSGALILAATFSSAFFLNQVVPSPLTFLSSAGQIVMVGAVYVVLALLWYAPFFAWVGLLSTLFRRWSIPLAFLIPALVSLAENLLFDGAGPDGGYVASYLHDRFSFGDRDSDAALAIFTDAQINGADVISRFLATVDWSQLAGGVIVAALLVWLASEYRRRNVAT
jgi:ABC-2 type transport system permease protein